jgi:HYR domain
VDLRSQVQDVGEPTGLNLTFTPVSGSLFGYGETSVTVTAVDAAGARSTGEFKVIVSDTTGPKITSRHLAIVVQANTPGGAIVHYPIATAEDVNAVRITYSHPSGSVFPMGETMVTITATDSWQNITTSHFNITVPVSNLAVNLGAIRVYGPRAYLGPPSWLSDRGLTPIVTSGPLMEGVSAVAGGPGLIGIKDGRVVTSLELGDTGPPEGLTGVVAVAGHSS